MSARRRRRRISSREQRIGKVGEDIADAALRMAGVRNIERIGTPVKIIDTMVYRGKTWNRIVFGERVAGDRRGELDNGLSVLAEIKTVTDRNLRNSDFRPHQPDALMRHAEYGNAVSLIVWVAANGVYIMRLPIAGFGERGWSIDENEAAQFDEETRLYIDRIGVLDSANAG